jgi:hypothetical protein
VSFRVGVRARDIVLSLNQLVDLPLLGGRYFGVGMRNGRRVPS